MMRQTWVKSHPRRLPERPDMFVQVHLELAQAYERDLQRKAAFEAELEDEIERMLDEEFR